MVEGPGCTLNGERMRKAGVVGQTVRAVSAQQMADAPKLQGLIGLQIFDVVTLGKELFIFVAALSSTMLAYDESASAAARVDTVVRVHFGMNGSLLVNALHRYNNDAAFELHLDRDVVRVYQSTVCLRCPNTTRKHIEKLSRYVCIVLSTALYGSF
jgi:formamidopyrimidine-DNA glycosylase